MWRSSDRTTSLAPTGQWSEAASTRLWKGDIDRLALNYTTGFCEPDLDFIEPCPIRALHVLDRRLALARKLVDIEAVTDLRDARSRRCDRFPGLDSLEALYAWESTRIVDGDLSPLLELPSLTELRMMSRRAYSPSLARVREQLAAKTAKAPL